MDVGENCQKYVPKREPEIFWETSGSDGQKRPQTVTEHHTSKLPDQTIGLYTKLLVKEKSLLI